MTYIFNRDFDAERDRERDGGDAAPAPRPMFTEEDLRSAERLACAEGFETGRERGRTEALAEAEAARASERQEALLALAGRVEVFCAEAAAHRAALENQMIEFALMACERVLPELMRTHSKDRAAAEVRRCLSLIMCSPTIRVFLSRGALETHRPAIEDALRDRHDGTQLELAADPELVDGDARVEWDSGVMDYSFGQITEQLLEALKRTRPMPAETIEKGSVAHG